MLTLDGNVKASKYGSKTDLFRVALGTSVTFSRGSRSVQTFQKKEGF